MRAAEASVVLLTNFVPPYRVPVLRELTSRVGQLRILVSTPMERDRTWNPSWEGLDVTVQRGVSRARTWRHPSGFRDRVDLHVPVDTIPRLSRFRPDVVISGEFGARSGQAALWCRLQRRPLVLWATLSERTEQGRGRARRALRALLLKAADGVIVNGGSGARYIRSFGYPAERIHVVPQASPITAAPPRTAAPEAPAEGPLRLLYVGRLVPLKGLPGLLHELSAWCTRTGMPLDLTLVGSGPQEAALRSIPTPDLLTVSVRGAVPFEQLGEVYGAADLLVFPSLADEWGLVVNEAMACGLPVLGSVHSQAVLELVEEGRTGWTFDPEEPGELQAAMDRVAGAGRDGIRRMGDAARRRVADLTPGAMAGALARVVEASLARAGRRG